MEAFGFSSPDQFFSTQVVAIAGERKSLRVLALGSGRCELEIQIARQLVNDGCTDLRIDCIDLTQHVMDDAANKACALGLENYMRFICDDLNTWTATDDYDVVIANHSLHHIVKLEQLFDAVTKAIRRRSGRFLVCDMIGRNGHLLWPEMLEEVEAWWRKLPPKKRLDRATGRIEPHYVNYDSSKVGFEGIRAQDILPLLIERFQFQLFIPYSGIVVPFIERRVGWNFDATSIPDQRFVDDLANREQELFQDMLIKPTQMIAILNLETGLPCKLINPKWTPQNCVRSTLN